jgi:hypothetical protein
MAKVKPVLNTYRVLMDGLNDAITAGIRRAHKHVETPSEELIAQEVENYVSNYLAEKIDWDRTDDTAALKRENKRLRAELKKKEL